MAMAFPTDGKFPTVSIQPTVATATPTLMVMD
jgi:hypothetical protein